MLSMGLGQIPPPQIESRFCHTGIEQELTLWITCILEDQAFQSAHAARRCDFGATEPPNEPRDPNIGPPPENAGYEWVALRIDLHPRFPIWSASRQRKDI